MDAFGKFVFVFGVFIDGHVHDDSDRAVGSHDFGALIVESFVGFDVGVVGVFLVEEFEGQAVQFKNRWIVGETEGSGVKTDDGAVGLGIVFVVFPAEGGGSVNRGRKDRGRWARLVMGVGTADGVGDTDTDGDEDDGEG